MRLRLLSYNIRYGGLGKGEQLAAVIRGCTPDLVMLQEATDPGVVAALARTTGLSHHGARPGHSTGFLSRLPVAEHTWHRPRGARHPFLEVVLAEPAIRVYGLHLSAWFNNWTERRRAGEIRALLRGISEHQHGFHAIVGDFNAVAPGETFMSPGMPRWIQAMVWLSGNDIARDTIQVMLDASYVDAWKHGNTDGPGFTFPTWDPHVRLDYVFVPRRNVDRVGRCRVIRSPQVARDASDHYPLLVELG